MLCRSRFLWLGLDVVRDKNREKDGAASLCGQCPLCTKILKEARPTVRKAGTGEKSFNVREVLGLHRACTRLQR